MSWWKYVVGIAGTDAQVEIAKAVKLDQSTVSRWKTSDAPGKAENVAKLARAYKRPVLEAFVAAKFLTEEEAKVKPAAVPDLTRFTNDELLELVRARMREEGELGGDTAAIGPEGRIRATFATPVTRAARKGSVKK